MTYPSIDELTARIAATNQLRVLGLEEWFPYWTKQLANVVGVLLGKEIVHLSTDFDPDTRAVTVLVVTDDSLVRVRVVAPTDTYMPELIEALAVPRRALTRLEVASLASSSSDGSVVTYGTFRATVGKDVFVIPAGSYSRGSDTVAVFESLRNDLIAHI